jgi:hypothetical protein
MNPLDEYVKCAQQMSLPFGAGSFFGTGGAGNRALNAIGGQVGEQGAKMVGGALAGGALLGLGAAIKKIHGAMTKHRDFKQMMGLNPQLAEAQQQRPEMFNQAYSSLRKMNPTFGADPIVAGAYMHKMMILNPEQAGMILAEAAGAKMQPSSATMKLGPLELKR